MNRRSVVTQWMLTSLAACFTLYFASDLLIPIAISIMGYLSLRHTVVRLCKWGLPRTIAAMTTIGIIALIAITLAATLYSPARTWLATAPQSVSKVQQKLHEIREPLETIDEATEEATTENAPDEVVEVELEKPQLIDSDIVLTRTGNALVMIAVITVTMFFLLSTGDEVINRILKILPTVEDRDKALMLVSRIQDAIGSYLGHITIINIGLGIVVSGVMWLMGMPSPVLWGAIATVFNFIPYVGPIAATAVIFVAAVGEFDSFTRSILTAIVFWLTTAIEGQFVTPTVLGKSLKLGPVIVLVAVAFWGFMWGIAGIFIAVPLVIAMRLTFDCFDATRPLATLLGKEDEDDLESCQQVQEDEEFSEGTEEVEEAN